MFDCIWFVFVIDCGTSVVECQFIQLWSERQHTSLDCSEIDIVERKIILGNNIQIGQVVNYINAGTCSITL